MYLTILRATKIKPRLTLRGAEKLRARYVDLPKVSVWFDGETLDHIFLWLPGAVSELRLIYGTAAALAVEAARQPLGQPAPAVDVVAETDRRVADMCYRMVGSRLFGEAENTIHAAFAAVLTTRKYDMHTGTMAVTEVLGRIGQKPEHWGSHLDRVSAYRDNLRAVFERGATVLPAVKVEFREWKGEAHGVFGERPAGRADSGPVPGHSGPS